MEKSLVLVAIVGMNHHTGKVFRVGETVLLIKEPDNMFDSEAIVVGDGCNKLAYVANSAYTVPNGAYSAGRLYDKFGEVTEATIIISDDKMVLAEVII